MKKNKWLLSLSIVLSMTILVVSPFMTSSATAANVIEMSYNDFFPMNYPHGKLNAAFAQEIEKRTNGQVKITLYHSGSLAPPPQCYQGVVTGISVIGHTCFAYTPGRFPLMEVVDLPGYPHSGLVTSKVAWEIYKKFRPRELDNVHVIYLHAHAPAGINMVKKPIHTLEDIKGMRIRSTGLSKKIAEALGTVPVALPITEAYDPLSKGVVDGTFAGYNPLKYYRFAEVTKYTIDCTNIGYVTGMVVFMNLQKWNALPPNIQKVFNEVGEEWVERHGKLWDQIEIEGFEFGKEKNHTFIALTEKEKARWAEKVIKPLEDEYIQSMEAKGIPAKEVVDYKHKMIEKYSKIYPPIPIKID
jgi:TRAP-type C4-dicarboxylate transport system substrate-binding protein